MENTVQKIKLSELVSKMKSRTSQVAKDAILKTIKFKNRISYVKKEITAKNIINASHFSYPIGTDVENLTQEELNKIQKIPVINQSKQYLLTALMMVDLYTNIELNFANGTNEYDNLIEYGILEYILINIPESEIKEFNMLIDYQYQQYYHNNHSIQSFLNNKINELKIEFVDFLCEFLQESNNSFLENKDELIALINKENNTQDV